jgi:hypothetical protein
LSFHQGSFSSSIIFGKIACLRPSVGNVGTNHAALRGLDGTFECPRQGPELWPECAAASPALPPVRQSGYNGLRRMVRAPGRALEALAPRSVRPHDFRDAPVYEETQHDAHFVL